MYDIATLRERKAALAVALTRPVERPEAVELMETEAALRAAELAEQEAAARELARRAAVHGPELERVRAATLKAIHAFAAAFDAEKLVRERAHAVGLYELGYWSVSPVLACPLLRIAAEEREANR